MEGAPIDIGTRRELFVDHLLVDALDGADLRLHEPHPAEVAVRFDDPWEDGFSFYPTVLQDGERFRMYYRGSISQSLTCYAESTDGISWTKPRLGLVEFEGSTANNIILAGPTTVAPFKDARPDVPDDELYKANSVERSGSEAGLIGYVSADGIRWRRLRDEPIVPSSTENAFDSQNVMFWSEVEQCYVLYARHMAGGRRATMRAASGDFREWTIPTPMTYSDTGSITPSAHLYTNQTQPYFRAPHIYISLPGRIFFTNTKHVTLDEDLAAAGKRVASPELERFYRENLGERSQRGVGDFSDAVLLSTRAGSTRFDFTFRESFVRPGLGLANWVTRTNYPACGVVQTSPTEMSVYLVRHYGQATCQLQRMALRLDGFASVHAAYEGGEMLTRPMVFSGRELEINYSTSAAGRLSVELQRPDGTPLPGRSLADCLSMTGDAIDQTVEWRVGSDLSELRGEPVRLRLALKDADLYSLRFRE